MAHLEAVFHHLAGYIHENMESTGAPGLALALTSRNELLGIGTYGYADVAAAIPMAPERLFQIGSVSKSFAAILLLQEWDAGRLDLDAPVERYLPWFKIRSVHDPITIHHLLSHTGGIICGSEFSPEAKVSAWALRDTVVGPPPGTVFHYSNVGYKVLGLVVEALAGAPFQEVLQARILDPLGMRHTMPAITHDIRRQLAVGHTFLYDDRPRQADHSLVPATWLETATADGGIASTAADMALYLRMLMSHGKHAGGCLLSENAFRRMIEPVIPTGDGTHGEAYAYGLTVEEDDGHRLIGHGGGMVGYCCQILFDLDDGLGVVALINGPGKPEELARFVLSALRAHVAGRPLPPLPPQRDPMAVENGADYVGLYGDPPALEVATRGAGLALMVGGREIVLEHIEGDRFFAHHPDWTLSPVHFGREEGTVVELIHGSDWYPHARYDGPRQWDVPAEWLAYPGHYAAHNPWYTNWRVVLRKGELVFLHPAGEEEPLRQIGEGLFRAGPDPNSPERLRFDTIIDGRAVRANLSGEIYYRTFTP